MHVLYIHFQKQPLTIIVNLVPREKALGTRLYHCKIKETLYIQELEPGGQY